ncbi:adhesion G protein-coupled receptor E1-like [Hoplias malabaricus]|uniref:adhesion G protein-coupled receptor E1-like n=1 Tax=Hoplias malabaricus TaxID=27720 RepID=UPI003461C651
MVFLSLTLLTCALFRRQLNANNVVLVNLCLSLLLTNLLLMLNQQSSEHLACAVVAGFLHFLFLSAFVWMLIDAVLLFISVKNLTKIRTNQKDALNWKTAILIGYLCPLIVVGVSDAAVHNGYNNTVCWLKENTSFSWSFYGPVYFILALNIILFVAIFIIIAFTLKNLNSDILQRRQTLADKKLIISILLKTMARFFTLGCPWMVGLIVIKTVDYNSVVILISLQGVFVFFIHCVLNQEVMQQCWRWILTLIFCKTPVNNILTMTASHTQTT